MLPGGHFQRILTCEISMKRERPPLEMAAPSKSLDVERVGYNNPGQRGKHPDMNEALLTTLEFSPFFKNNCSAPCCGGWTYTSEIMNKNKAFLPSVVLLSFPLKAYHSRGL